MLQPWPALRDYAGKGYGEELAYLIKGEMTMDAEEERQKKLNVWQAARVEMIIAKLNAIKTVLSLSTSRHRVLEWYIARVKGDVDEIEDRHLGL